jgi:uncharacterized membrane protein YkvA (DUF1232 family)
MAATRSPGRSAMRWGALRSLATATATAVRPGTPGLGARLASIPRLVRATTTGAYAGTSGRRLLALAAALLYVVSPVDLLPELVLPFLGLGDDALVITWVAASLVNETESFLRWERDRDRTVRGHVIR